ncbi:hypothetical protein D3C76_1140810 [compost metagenome]
MVVDHWIGYRRFNSWRGIWRWQDVILDHAKREVLLLFVDRIAAVKRRQIEVQAAFVDRLDATVDKRFVVLGFLAGVHSHQDGFVHVDFVRHRIEPFGKQRFHSLDGGLKRVVVVKLVDRVHAEA